MAKNAQAPGVWVTEENGYEKTNSQEMIKRTLSLNMQKRRNIVLLFKGYQSGSTVFVSIDSSSLLVDKPMDWPGLPKVRVVFKDEAKVWNHFTVSVIGEGKDTVKLKFPTELFRLQRRAHFRIEAPRGSKASFVRNDEHIKDVAIGNISIGGLMFCYAKGDEPEKIKDQEVITNIEVELLPSSAGDGSAKKLTISKGVCVRSFIDQKAQKYCLGVQFMPRPNEEMKLMQHIRQLELEELRKGVISV